ncbi:urease accessory protein UreH domain-containing protein [Robiginitalea aurantiaca]|uniref:Sulfite exporter TauE/SafE family protein n=1 Tax=Robiginitalea aurantiaca TaxID=3056915 RepID=A0ABT7WB59_9FLAO|nr:sulfite exporter TauE/SafE family protein [Robiginitalea aurantiaca]MDM9630147.1 sulfite exporter TauE/SafE family protein [Robiginitalea aurantiaca]
MIFAFTSGLLASMLHVISGPDHLAAVTPFAIARKKKAWKIGLIWGLAHLTGMVVIGLLFLLFREAIPVEAISAYSEQLVGLVLVLIGIWALYSVFIKGGIHSHTHIHDGESPYLHKHPHSHSSTDTHSHVHKQEPKNHQAAAFSIGFLHGLAGIAHFLLFLPVLSFDSQDEAVVYIIGFGTGTVLAMTVFTLVLGRVSELATNWHNPLFFRGIRVAGGLFAIVIGVYWMFSN